MATSDATFSIDTLFWEYQVVKGPSLEETKSAMKKPFKTKLTVLDSTNKSETLDAYFTKVEKRDADDEPHYAVFMTLGGVRDRFMMYDPVQQHGAVQVQDEDFV